MKLSEFYRACAEWDFCTGGNSFIELPQYLMPFTKQPRDTKNSMFVLGGLCVETSERLAKSTSVEHRAIVLLLMAEIAKDGE